MILGEQMTHPTTGETGKYAGVARDGRRLIRLDRNGKALTVACGGYDDKVRWTCPTCRRLYALSNYVPEKVCPICNPKLWADFSLKWGY